MKKSYNFPLLLLSILLLVLIVSCNSGSDKVSNINSNVKTKNIKKKDEKKSNSELTRFENQHLKLSINEQFTSLHPATAKGTSDTWVLDHLFEGLTKKTPKGELIGGMASNWYTDDGKVWYFVLKDNVRWSDGTKVTAKDFEYAWKYVLNPETSSQYAYLLYGIKGAEKYNNATNKKQIEKLERKVGVKAINEYTLKVTLEKRIPYFAEIISSFPYFPINKEAQENNRKWAFDDLNFVTNGPFKLHKWNKNSHLVIVKNNNYYGEEAIKLNKIKFKFIEDDNEAIKMFNDGDIDILFPLSKTIDNKISYDSDDQLKVAPDLAIYYYNLNNNVKPLNNKKIRQALSLSINRHTIVNQVFKGRQKPAYSIVPPEIIKINNNDNLKSRQLFEENVGKAKKLLKEGLKEEKLSEFPKLTLLYNVGEGHEKVAKVVKEMWSQNLGINIKLEEVEFQEKIAREHFGDYNISRAGWVGDYVDPAAFINLWSSESNFNDTNWQNNKFDTIVTKAKRELHKYKRQELLLEAETILIEEMPIIPIYFYTKPFLVQQYVKDIYTPIDKYPQLMFAYVMNKQ